MDWVSIEPWQSMEQVFGRQDRILSGRARKAGVMGVVVAGGEVHPGDAVRVEWPTGDRRALEPV